MDDEVTALATRRLLPEPPARHARHREHAVRVRAMITTIAGIIGGFTAATLDTPWWVNLAIGTALTWFVCVLFPDSPVYAALERIDERERS